MQQYLEDGLAALNLSADCVPALLQYADLLREKNKVMNLTAITEPKDVAALHFLDSLQLLKFVRLEGKTVADVGTGAGFPGLPLRIAVPSIRLTLLDSLGKRVTFLQEVCDNLGLWDVACIHVRAEEFAGKHREHFDIVTSRAVAALPVLCELCLPLVQAGGLFLAMKSADDGSELHSAEHAISVLGGKVESVQDYTIPGTDVTHRLIIIRKLNPTPQKYPRTFAKIKKAPL